MSPALVVPCGCCRVLVKPIGAFFDTELRAHCCDDCRKQLVRAKAILSLPTDEERNPINLRGVYRGEDAPDNFPPEQISGT